MQTLRRSFRSLFQALRPPRQAAEAHPTGPALYAGRRRLLLHAGAPKTGTTALQHAWQDHRAALRSHGILYPQVDLLPGSSPRHQWLVSLLLSGDFDAFRANVGRVMAEAAAAGTNRVILSTEGIFNHWFDLTEAGKAVLAALREQFDVTVWVVLREPVAWAMAMYVQAARNPPYPLAPAYATAEPPESVLKQEFFASRLRYDRFIKDAEGVFGEGSVIVTRYEDGDILAAARRLLSVDESVLRSDARRNPTLSALGLDLLLRLNRLSLEPGVRARLVASIVEIDARLGATSERVVPSRATRQLIEAMACESNAYLAERYGIIWDTKG